MGIYLFCNCTDLYASYFILTYICPFESGFWASVKGRTHARDCCRFATQSQPVDSRQQAFCQVRTRPETPLSCAISVDSILWIQPLLWFPLASSNELELFYLNLSIDFQIYICITCFRGRAGIHTFMPFTRLTSQIALKLNPFGRSHSYVAISLFLRSGYHCHTLHICTWANAHYNLCHPIKVFFLYNEDTNTNGWISSLLEYDFSLSH